jgi:hypothetical protein
MAKPDDAGRVIAGLLTYNPGPGIYSRLERAIQAMPENVRTQELPGLLKRYKDGVPGWELKAVDLDSVIGQRPAVSREELLQAVKERSPVYTHKEVVLGGNPAATETPPVYESPDVFSFNPTIDPVHSDAPSPIGSGVSHGRPRFENYGQGGERYSELLLIDPSNPARDLPHPHHFHPDYPGNPLDVASKETRRAAAAGTVGHARFDTHGDALRINEIQSDINNFNIKSQKDRSPRQGRTESDADYQEALQNAGWRFNLGDDGEIVGEPFRRQLPFALEDAWSDLLIKRLALEAARQGHRAIEVVSPRAAAISGGDMDHLQHLYGKVVPGALERLGRKMGGLTDDTPTAPSQSDYRNQVRTEVAEIAADARMRLPPDVHPHYRQLARAISDNLLPETIMEEAEQLARSLEESGRPSANLMPGLMRLAERDAAAMNAWENVRELEPIGTSQSAPPGRRYLMSDEMRRRLIQEGVGAAVATGVMSQDDLIDRLNQ